MSAVWYQDDRTDDGIIVSSRVRLARNIRKYPFKLRLSDENARRMIQEAVDSVINGRTPLGTIFRFIPIAEFTDMERQVFLEKHIVSPEFVKDGSPRGLLLKNDENVSIMLNEEDHIRIQSVIPGDGLPDAFDTAGRMDDLMEETVEYAFDKDYGYLTSCPTNTGTGLRASYMTHLPILEKTEQLKNLLPAISKFGITIRGLYGEGTESMGGMYQISNQLTLGKSEQDIMQGLQNVAKNVIERENWLRMTMLNKHRADIENNIYRAYGVLAYGKKIGAKEAMDLLSEIRLGYITGLLELPRPEKRIYQIMMEIQPGHLQRVAGRELSEAERDAARADYLRRIFPK